MAEQRGLSTAEVALHRHLATVGNKIMSQLKLVNILLSHDKQYAHQSSSDSSTLDCKQ